MSRQKRQSSDSVVRFIENVRREVHRTGVALTDLSTASGIGYRTLTRILNEGSPPTLYQAEVLADAVGVPLETLMGSTRSAPAVGPREMRLLHAVKAGDRVGALAALADLMEIPQPQLPVPNPGGVLTVEGLRRVGDAADQLATTIRETIGPSG